MKLIWKCCRKISMRCKNKIALILCVMIAGCATAPVRHANWAPVENGRVLTQAMRAMEALSRQRRSMRAQLKIAAPFLPGKTAADGVIVAQPMDLMRLDLTDPAGDMVAGVDLSLNNLDLWLPNQRRVYETDSADDSLARVTHLPWTWSEFFSLLQGLPPTQFGEESTDWSVDPDGMAVNGNGDAIMALDPGLHLPQSFIRYKNEQHKKAIYEVQYDDYRPTKLGMYPHHITVHFFRSNKTVELWLDHVEWNPTVAWGALDFDLPEGTKVIHVR